jgi:hypothetical protein
MDNNEKIEDLIKLLDEANEKNNKVAIEVITKAILDYSELQSLRHSIASDFSLAKSLLSAGSQ